MKLDINLRVLFSALFLILLTSTIYPTNSNAEKPSDIVGLSAPCIGNGTGIITIPGTTDCELQPDIQKITFLRIDLCIEEPTAPTTSAALDRTNCQTYFKNDDGAEASVEQGVNTPIGVASDYLDVNHGTYTHGSITMSNVFKYTSSVTFTDEMKDVDSDNGSTICVTRPGSIDIIYGYNNNINSAQSNVSCTAGAVASEISIGINTMTMDDNNDCTHLLNFNGTNGIVAGYALEADDTLVDGVGAVIVEDNDVDQIKANKTGCRTGTDNGISKVMGVMAFQTPLVIGANTAGIQVEFNNTQGLKLDDGGNTNRIFKWDVAFFDFTLTAVPLPRNKGDFR
jgi:hypothetical protein